MKLFKALFLLTVFAGTCVLGLRAQSEGKQAAERPVSYQITGVAVSGRDGSPIPFCQLQVSPANLGPRPQPAVRVQRFGLRNTEARDRNRNVVAPAEAISADVHGRFRIVVPRAGAWELTGRARGFRNQAFEEHEGYSEAIVLSVAAPTFAATLRLDPDAAIMGAIFDEAGEPVANAQVSVHTVEGSGVGAGLGRTVENGQSDDRGHYEVARLPPGRYRLAVQARPWYAGGVGGGRALFGRDTATVRAPLSAGMDPSLDVVYAVTWFPGTEEEPKAEVITLSGGEERQADFHLQPIEAGKAILARPISQEGGQIERREGRQWNGPQIERITEAGNAEPAGFLQPAPDGWAVGTLQPGTYRVRMPVADGQTREDLRQFVVKAGGGGEIDLANAEPLVNVQLLFADGDGSGVQVHLTAIETRLRYNEERNRRRPGFGNPQAETKPLEVRTIAVPAGSYLISAEGEDGQYLDSVTAAGAQLSGRKLQIGGETPVITLMMEDGRGIISGTVRKQDQALAGAMVLLVPALALAEEISGMIQRDESNTDGSFTLPNVVPGRYILVAIDRGWTVNWRDPETLARYLIQGVPLEIRPRQTMNTEVKAVTPQL